MFESGKFSKSDIRLLASLVTAPVQQPGYAVIQDHGYVTLKSDHAGHQCLTMLLDSFKVAGPYGQHICLVHQPLGMSLNELKMRARGKVFTKGVLRSSIRKILAAVVDYLHMEAYIIRTDKSSGFDETMNAANCS
ncbi:hypothetical protein ACJ73_03727 [Blastomyces percursus]|uniref:non-specific serine/threonine protein kinase n=1 Tax=Blastomyces percursus TaxID=1658174 RepID=A0A1J9R8S2_9EURO|nr:hypothetical protein ACJ73_03727 [Blastomyces percursus]